MKMTLHEVGTRSYGPEEMAVCSCHWESGYWVVDAPDSVRDHQQTHLNEVGALALDRLYRRNEVHDVALD